MFRQKYRAQIRNVVLIQSLQRKRLARRELLALKQEAKSVVHFKEVSYKLENKVVELTQTLQKRTQENKSLQSKLNELQTQLESWMSKYDEIDRQTKDLKSQVDKPTVDLPEFEALDEEKKKAESQLAESLRKVYLLFLWLGDIPCRVSQTPGCPDANLYVCVFFFFFL